MEQVKAESIERKKRLEQEMAVGVAQEQERLMRREIERQRNEVKRMEEQRLARTNMLRTRHDMEMEEQRQNRAKITEQHNSLRSVIDGNNMKAPDEYKAPPNWQPPPQHHHHEGGGGGWGPEQRGGGDNWHDQGGYRYCFFIQCRVKTCTSVTSTQTDPLTGPVNHMTTIITIISHLTIMADITTINLIIIITMAAPIIGPINHAVVARHAAHHVVIITIVVVDNDVVRTEYTR